MRTALAVLSLVAVIAAEAPYHLHRPAGPAFHLPSAPAPPPPPPVRPPPPPPAPIPHFAPQPQPIFAPHPHLNLAAQPHHNFGYQYQQPNIAPAFVQPAPLPHFPVHAHPQPALPVFQPATAPQLAPIHHHQPQPIPSFPQPSPSYGLPQSVPRAPPPPPAPIHHHHHQIFAPQPAPQPLPLPQPQFQQPIALPQQQFSHQQGYNYQQPQFVHQSSANIPLQAQPLSNNFASSALSSYQADSNQYSGVHEQIHRDALDSVVVDRVQKIIKEDEHSSAQHAGFLSLVSGVSLEHAKPSVEISSFVHTSPLGSSQSSSHGSSSAAFSSPSRDYGLPAITANTQSSGSDSTVNFLPQNKPAQSYGSPY